MADTKFALFDFDSTLCKGDSILPFLFFCIRKREASPLQLAKATAAFAKQKLHPDSVSAAKAATLSFLKGRSAESIRALGQAFFRERLRKDFFPEGLEELKKLKQQGYTILIISASPDCYMQVLPEFMPVDGVLATRCLPDENDCFSGVVGENCKGYQKPLRLAEYLAAHGLRLDYEASCAYGDSASDAPMLQQTANPVCVNPRKGLRESVPGARVVHWRVS